MKIPLPFPRVQAKDYAVTGASLTDVSGYDSPVAYATVISPAILSTAANPNGVLQDNDLNRKTAMNTISVRIAFYGLLMVALSVGIIGLPDRLCAQNETAGARSTPAGVAKTEALSSEAPIPTRSMWDMLRAGGPLLIPIVLCSFIFVVFAFERTVALRRGNVIPRPFVKRFLEQLAEGQLDAEQALKLCDDNRSTVAKVFAGAVRKWGRPAVEVEQAIIDAGERATNHLRKYLRVINGVATVSPLLGLLGTVWGMMEAFNSIATAEAMGRPELLAGGISQALLTTAAGLFVAIPALICYMFFIGRVDRHIIEIDDLGQQLVDLISAEAIRGDGKKKSPDAGRRGKAA